MTNVLDALSGGLSLAPRANASPTRSSAGPAQVQGLHHEGKSAAISGHMELRLARTPCSWRVGAGLPGVEIGAMLLPTAPDAAYFFSPSREPGELRPHGRWAAKAGPSCANGPRNPPPAESVNSRPGHNPPPPRQGNLSFPPTVPNPAPSWKESIGTIRGDVCQRPGSRERRALSHCAVRHFMKPSSPSSASRGVRCGDLGATAPGVSNQHPGPPTSIGRALLHSSRNSPRSNPGELILRHWAWLRAPAPRLNSIAIGRNRLYLSRDKYEFYPNRADLCDEYSVNKSGGWWMGTNYSRSTIELACQVAKLTFGTDSKLI